MSFNREPLHKMLTELVAVSRGSRPASLVIRGGTLVNVCSGELLEGMSVAFCGPRIAYVGKDVSHTIGEGTRIVEADGRYIAPGLLDGHCHIESTQMTASSFARAVLPRGTTGGFFDPHEIANVLGLEGIRLMLEEARTTPLAAYMQAASCVPAAGPAFETSGASLGPDEVAEALSWGGDVIGLGEVMNFPGVVYGDEHMLGEIAATLRAGKIVDGHFTWPASDWRLPVYAAAGVTGDHENVTPEDVIERVRLGMYAKLRQGSAWHDVANTIRAHTERGLDPRRIMLVTDDRSAESLLDEGHMDFVVRLAIRQGVKPVTAFQMATLNTAERFGVARDVGSVTPGAYGDVILLDGPLSDVNVSMTVAAGRIVAENGRMTVDWPAFAYPPSARETVRVGRGIRAEDFAIRAPVEAGQLTARAVEPIENRADTKERMVQVAAADGFVRLDPATGLCKIAVFERHFATGGRSVGLLSGLGFDRPAAIAMTVAHDSHNLLVVGNDDALMAEAANAVIGCQGGIAVLGAGAPVLFELPVAGLMSDADPETVAERSRAVGRALKEVGCGLNNALMTISLLALVVIPELRLSDQGLVRISPDGIRKVPLFPDYE
ncbi:adenine deaminase [Cohnella candidum]|uniref:Adenine deaminase n=1 Tax=Cohnella candidum TaxID=2674991 RepID=A0A3G3K5B5_9BACL|nr:adenine deaminase C-terminal domain-containing protein [Cohnella candidum]AYQ75620.1 adenine deaminase [Cohnella candidum]